MTKECGLPDEVKQDYFKAEEDEIEVNQISPTGYPMRMLKSSPAIGDGIRPNCEAYGYLLDAKGNSVRGVRVCRSLSQRLGLHFLTVTRESRSTIRAVYDVDEGVRVYEVHGDLLFAGAEQVLRTVDRDTGEFRAAILDVSRLDSVNDAARGMVMNMSSQLRAEGRAGFLVDPDRAVIRTQSQLEELWFSNVEDAVAAARAWVLRAAAGSDRDGQ